MVASKVLSGHLRSAHKFYQLLEHFKTPKLPFDVQNIEIL